MRLKNREELRKLAVDLYQKLNDGHAVARKLDLSATTTYRLLNEAGIELVSLPEISARKKKLKGESAMLVVDEYKRGTSIAEISRKYGIGQQAIYSAVKDAGVDRRPRGQQPRRFPDEHIAEIIRLYKEEGFSQEQIAVKFRCSQSVVSRILRTNGVSFYSNVSGEQHGNWAGGRIKAEHGYIQVGVSVSDPLAVMRNRQGYVLEHRLVMARALGRPLEEYESVHHIDGRHDNNALENLQLRFGKHGKGQVYQCADCGSYHVVPVELKEESTTC